MQVKSGSEEKDFRKTDAEEASKNAILLQHVSKEIELIFQNTYSMRMRVMYTVWIGPFILLGAMILANEGPIKIGSDMPVWISVGVSFLGYIFFAIIFGRYERGNWRRCDALRSLAADLAGREDIGPILRDERYGKNVILYYFILSTNIAVIFACCLVFATLPL